jgi:L-ascorbate metabolism protein UlaG (beta-lactamase superfamily)
MAMKLTSYGHSCFAVEISGTTLLFDPFITPNELAKSIKLSDVKADYMLITHGHFDHIADAVELAKQTGAKVISNFEIYQWLGSKGIENAHPMNHGGSFDFDFGTVKFVNAIHSSVLPDGTYGGNPGGFVVSTPELTFYNSGDTALTYDMKLIAEEFPINVAMLPIGGNFTMNAKDAARAAEFVGTRKVVGLHYDTFPPIRIDKEAAILTMKAAGIELVLPGIGETVTL